MVSSFQKSIYNPNRVLTYFSDFRHFDVRQSSEPQNQWPPKTYIFIFSVFWRSLSVWPWDYPNKKKGPWIPIQWPQKPIYTKNFIYHFCYFNFQMTLNLTSYNQANPGFRLSYPKKSIYTFFELFLVLRWPKKRKRSLNFGFNDPKNQYKQKI